MREAEKDELLKFLDDYWDSHRTAPSYREIKEGMGLKSTSKVYRLIQELDSEGRVSRGGHKQHRAIRSSE